MKNNSEKKNGFFASLFAPKKCCCQNNFVVEEVDSQTTTNPSDDKSSDCCVTEKDSCCCSETASSKSMQIKVFGTGCAKCATLYSMVEKVIHDNNVQATLVKVEDIVEIMNAGIMATPALMVDGVIKFKGRVASEADIKKALGL